MVSLYDGGIYLVNGKEIVPEQESVKVEALTGKKADKEADKKGNHCLFYFKRPQYS